MDKNGFHYPYDSSFKDKVVAVLALLNEATVSEIAAELVELQGIASEEGVAECTVSVKEVLNHLVELDKVQFEGADEKKRYKLRS